MTKSNPDQDIEIIAEIVNTFLFMLCISYEIAVAVNPCNMFLCKIV